MRRGVSLLLRATLLLWRPLDFAMEFPSTLMSIGHRGVPGIVELLVHGAVAALAVAAVQSLSNTTSSSLWLARAALVASAVTSIQSLYWSVLPHQTMPSDRLLLAGASVTVAAAWLIYLWRLRETES